MATKDKDGKHWVSARYKCGELYYAPIERAIEILQAALVEQQAGNWKNLAIETGEQYGDTIIELRGERLETDEERAGRESLVKQQEEYQRQQYEVLKKKFEPK